MTDKLVNSVFEKAGKESGKDSVHGKAEYLSEHIFEIYKFSVSSKTLSRYQKKEYSPSHPLTDYFSKFLGYKNYGEFVKHESDSILKPEEKERKRNRGWLITLILMPIIGISAYVGYESGKEECMVWDIDHYVMTECEGRLNERKFIPHIYNNLKKVKVYDTTTFFKKGEAQIWYDKSNGHLDFFTAPGVHPVNGKTLKPITNYMIEKYVRN